MPAARWTAARVTVTGIVLGIADPDQLLWYHSAE